MAEKVVVISLSSLAFTYLGYPHQTSSRFPVQQKRERKEFDKKRYFRTADLFNISLICSCSNSWFFSILIFFQFHMLCLRATIPGFILSVPLQLFPLCQVHALAKPKPLPPLQQVQVGMNKRTKLAGGLMKKCIKAMTDQKYTKQTHPKGMLCTCHSLGAQAKSIIHYVPCCSLAGRKEGTTGNLWRGASGSQWSSRQGHWIFQSRPSIFSQSNKSCHQIKATLFRHCLRKGPSVSSSQAQIR